MHFLQRINNNNVSISSFLPLEDEATGSSGLSSSSSSSSPIAKVRVYKNMIYMIEGKKCFQYHMIENRSHHRWSPKRLSWLQAVASPNPWCRRAQTRRDRPAHQSRSPAILSPEQRDPGPAATSVAQAQGGDPCLSASLAKLALV